MRIGLDVDEVLAEFLQGMLPWLRAEYDMRVSWYDMHTYAFYEAWHVTEDVARERIDRFLESQVFKSLDLVPGSRSGVARLAGEHSLVVVTSRPEYVGDVTRRWLKRSYGDVFEEVLLTNSHGVGASTSKAALVEEHGVDVHVDDNPAYCNNIVERTCADAVLLSKPWNTSRSVDDEVFRAVSWEDILGVVEWIDT
jgi:uncharacterized HAD superfamily protein